MRHQEDWTPEEERALARMYRERWSNFEAAYRLHKGFGTVRSNVALKSRIKRLGVADNTRRGGGTYVTTEALAWYNQTFSEAKAPGKRLHLAESPDRANSTKQVRKSKKTRARDVVGLAELKHENEPNPSYTVLCARLAREGSHTLAIVLTLLESAVDEGKTAPEVIDDIRLINK